MVPADLHQGNGSEVDTLLPGGRDDAGRVSVDAP
jgi:hypothetical protein